MCLVFAVSLLVPGEIPTVESDEYSRDVQRKAVAATVRIMDRSDNHKGSGVIVGQGGGFVYILTAQHLVDKADGLEVYVFSRRSYPREANVYRPAEVLAQDKDQDLALIRLATKDRMPGQLRICPADSIPEKNQFAALTVGCSFGQAPICAVDQVQDRTRIRKRAGDPPVWVWQMERRPAKGRSGGPLLDKTGNLLGICSGRSDDRGYFTPVDVIHQFLKRERFKWLLQPDDGN